MKISLTPLVIAGFIACNSFSAVAQTTPSADKATMTEHMHHGGPMRKMDPAKLQAMVTKRLSDLRTKLKISASQETAWATFAAAMQPDPKMLRAHLDKTEADRAELEKLSTPERIDKMKALHAQRHEAMRAAMDQRGEAIKTFYATLSDEQKRTFDAQHLHMGPDARHPHHTPRPTAIKN